MRKDQNVAPEAVEEKAPEIAKTDEQLASEANLDRAIPDEAAPDGLEAAHVVGDVPITDTANNLAQLLNLASMGLGMAKFKAVSAVWNPNDNKRLADAAIPVLRKAAWGLRFIEFLDGKTGVEELALFMVAAPMAMSTYQAVQVDLAAMQPPKQQDEPEAKAAEEVAA